MNLPMDLAAFQERCTVTLWKIPYSAPGDHMCLGDMTGIRELITPAATAEVPEDKPAICGSVTLNCVDEEDPVRLSMPMLDALLLLNSLRAIEHELGLEEWSAQIGCSLGVIEDIAAALQLRYSDSPDQSVTLN